MAFVGRLFYCSENIHSLCHTPSLPLENGYSCPMSDGMTCWFYWDENVRVEVDTPGCAKT